MQLEVSDICKLWFVANVMKLMCSCGLRERNRVEGGKE